MFPDLRNIPADYWLALWLVYLNFAENIQLDS